MLRHRSRTANLRKELAKALSAKKVNRVLDLYERIEKCEPKEPRWSHRKGDLLQRMGRKAEAVLAYERCVELYAASGFVARAAAMAKVIIAIDASKSPVLERVDPDSARRLHRQSATARSGVSRFRKTEQTRPAKLGLTDVELCRRPPPPEPLISERPSAGTLAQLPSMLLFAEVPPEILQGLIRESTLVDVQDGQRFVTAGTAAEALYVLIQGNAVGQRGTDTQSLLLGEGDVAGVSCLLSNVSYGEDVTACGRTRVLRISKDLLERLVARHPPLGDLLLEILGRRLVATLFRTSAMFAAFDEATRAKIARLFEVRRAAVGTRFLEAGEVADGMYLPLHGRVVARKADGTRVGDIELGWALGQESLVTRRPSPITVEAASDVLMLRMPAQAFHELLVRRPDVVQHIDAARRRKSGRYSIRAGGTAH